MNYEGFGLTGGSGGEGRMTMRDENPEVFESGSVVVGGSSFRMGSTSVPRSNNIWVLFESSARLVASFLKRCPRNRKKVPTGSSQKQNVFIKLRVERDLAAGRRLEGQRRATTLPYLLSAPYFGPAGLAFSHYQVRGGNRGELEWAGMTRRVG
jgi:hypothetical protein